jgi:hypothetical protein
MLTAFGAAVALSSRPFYALCAFAGVALGMAGLLGYRQALRSIHRGVWAAPYYFLSMNLALLIGFWRFVSGQQGAVWQRTPRHREL